MKIRDYIFLTALFVALLFLKDCRKGKTESEELMVELLNRELSLSDSIAQNKMLLNKLYRAQDSAQENLQVTTKVVNNYLQAPQNYTPKDSSDCFHLISDVNECQGLLTSLRNKCNKANETNLGLIYQYKLQNKRQESLLGVKDEKIKLLSPKGSLFITASTQIGRSGITAPIFGVSYVSKRNVVLEYEYDYLNLSTPNRVTVGFKIFEHK